MKKPKHLKNNRRDFALILCLGSLSATLKLHAGRLEHAESPTYKEESAPSQTPSKTLPIDRLDLEKIIDEALSRMASESEKTPKDSSKEYLNELFQAKPHHLLDFASQRQLNFLRVDYLRKRIESSTDPTILSRLKALETAIENFQRGFDSKDLYQKDSDAQNSVFLSQDAGKVLSVDPQLLGLPDYLKFNFEGSPEEIAKNFSIPSNFAALTNGIAEDFEKQTTAHLKDIDESSIQDESKREAIIASTLPLAKKYIREQLALAQPKDGENLLDFERRRQRENFFFAQSSGHFRDLLSSEIVLDKHNPYAVYFAARNVDAINQGQLTAFPTNDEAKPLIFRYHSPQVIISRLALERAMAEYSQNSRSFFSADTQVVADETLAKPKAPPPTPSPNLDPRSILRQEIINKNYWWSRMGNDGDRR